MNQNPNHLQPIQLIQITQKASKRIPETLQGPTYYSDNDLWLYEQSEHPNMCEECASYNLQQFSGSQLRTEFKWHEIIDVNFIYPKVHPHCFCGLVRLYPVSEGYDSEGDRVYRLPSKTNNLSEEGEAALMSLQDKDFDGAVDAMLFIGYITTGLARSLREKKKQTEVK
jgi:hypothetical protein